MLQVVAGRRAAASLAAIALILTSAAASAQSDAPAAVPAPAPLPPVPPAPDQPLDPSAPLDPWPDLNVDWPDMEAPDTEIPDAPDAEVTESAATRTYTYRIDGLGEIDSAALLAQFRGLSALEEYRGDPANAAQIDRRARAEADLLAELMRA